MNEKLEKAVKGLVEADKKVNKVEEELNVVRELAAVGASVSLSSQAAQVMQMVFHGFQLEDTMKQAMISQVQVAVKAAGQAPLTPLMPPWLAQTSSPAAAGLPAVAVETGEATSLSMQAEAAATTAAGALQRQQDSTAAALAAAAEAQHQQEVAYRAAAAFHAAAAGPRQQPQQQAPATGQVGAGAGDARPGADPQGAARGRGRSAKSRSPRPVRGAGKGSAEA